MANSGQRIDFRKNPNFEWVPKRGFGTEVGRKIEGTEDG